jgi:hypothetical protein
VISYQKHYLVKYHSDSTHNYSEVEIKKMLEFLIDNIYVIVGGQVFQQSVGIPMGENCAPLLVDVFPYSYEANLFKSFYMRRKNLLLWPSIRYFVILTMFYLFTIYVNLIYPSELEIKDTT